MRVLFHCNYPLAWAPGGHEVQVRRTESSLKARGVKVQWLHAEDPAEAKGQILHYWTRPPNDQHCELARKKGMRLIVSECLQASVLHHRAGWTIRGVLRPALRRIMGRGLYGTLGVGIYRVCDAALVLNQAEADYLVTVYGADPNKVHVVPNGVEDLFFDKSIEPDVFDGLIYLAYITPRKNSVEVARAAKASGVPVRFVGGPSNCSEEYLQAFCREVDGRTVVWEKAVNDRRRICALLRGASGAFLASRNESQPLALLESLACGTPVMAPDLLAIRSSYVGDRICYGHTADQPVFARDLRSFYEQCSEGLVQDVEVPSWHDVSARIESIYRSVLK
jgi:glycosyltransferase involved in cell wall biosynthesis